MATKKNKKKKKANFKKKNVKKKKATRRAPKTPKPRKKKPLHGKKAKKKVIGISRKVKVIKKIKKKGAKKVGAKPKIKAKKKPKGRNTLIKKTKIKVKKTKKAKKEIKEVGLTPEEIQRISDILSKPIIRHKLVDLGGENAIAIVRNFTTGVSDEDIAKKLTLKISDVRAALNRLHSEGIVAYNRRKDSETGWYSYSWYLNKEKMERWAELQLSKFEGQCDEGVDYYVCPSCGGSAIFEFDEAFEKSFRCEICNSQLEFVDEKKKEELGMNMQFKRL